MKIYTVIVSTGSDSADMYSYVDKGEAIVDARKFLRGSGHMFNISVDIFVLDTETLDSTLLTENWFIRG